MAFLSENLDCRETDRLCGRCQWIVLGKYFVAGKKVHGVSFKTPTFLHGLAVSKHFAFRNHEHGSKICWVSDKWTDKQPDPVERCITDYVKPDSHSLTSVAFSISIKSESKSLT